MFRLQVMPDFESGNQTHKTESSTCTKGSRVRPTSRAYSDADPGLVCPAAAAAASDNLFRLRRMNPNATDTYDRLRRCSLVLVQHNNPYSPGIMHGRFDHCKY